MRKSGQVTNLSHGDLDFGSADSICRSAHCGRCSHERRPISLGPRRRFPAIQRFKDGVLYSPAIFILVLSASGNSYLNTVSIGISTWNAEDKADPDHLISAADRALYAAKQNGRDRVELIELHSLAME
jgi:GGDEF domain-containing protein